MKRFIMPRYILTGILLVFDIWIFLSWIDVVNHNMTDHIYKWWNCFSLLFSFYMLQ